MTANQSLAQLGSHCFKVALTSQRNYVLGAERDPRSLKNDGALGLGLFEPSHPGQEHAEVESGGQCLWMISTKGPCATFESGALFALRVLQPT